MSLQFASVSSLRPRKGLFFFCAIATLCLMILTATVSAQGQGKGRGGGGGGGGGGDNGGGDDGGGDNGGGSAPLPPVRYQAHLWALPPTEGANTYFPEDTNNQLQTVGRLSIRIPHEKRKNHFYTIEHGLLYDPSRDPLQAFDLNTIVSGIPAGQFIEFADSINECGQIAAIMKPLEGGWRQAVVIDASGFASEETPTLHIIPDRYEDGIQNEGFALGSIATGINDCGDVVANFTSLDGVRGTYVYNIYDETFIFFPWETDTSPPQINNDRTIVGRLSNGDGYRAFLDPNRDFLDMDGVFVGDFFIQTFPGLGLKPAAINEKGAFCGELVLTSPNSGFVYDDEPGNELKVFETWAWDLNASLDLVLGNRLIHQAHGLLRVSELLDPDHESSSLLEDASVSIRKMTDRDPLPEFEATGFPVLTARIQIDGVTMGVNFIPVPYPDP